MYYLILTIVDFANDIYISPSFEINYKSEQVS